MVAAACVVSFQEQIAGALKLLKGRPPAPNVLRSYDLLRGYLRFYHRVGTLPFDERAGAEFERLERASTKPVPTNDLRIAAIASVHGLTLLTRNAKDFERVPGLRFEDWTAPPPA